MRIVADTNTVVSGLLWSGPPQQLIDAAREKRLVLYSSTALFAEIAEVIGRQQFALRIREAGISCAKLESWSSENLISAPVAIKRRKGRAGVELNASAPTQGTV